jgi:hypothetical protein
MKELHSIVRVLTYEFILSQHDFLRWINSWNQSVSPHIVASYEIHSTFRYES